MNSRGILILGGAGFVGTSLVNRLHSAGHKLYVVSTNPLSVEYNSTCVKSYVSTLDDSKILKEVLPRCNIVFYLASHSTPGFSAHKPSIEAQSNLLPCLHFLEVLEKYTDTLLVYLSSGGAVYGDVANESSSEKLPLKPLSYYGAGKAAIEKFLLAYQAQTGNNILILRPSNLYGPGQQVREGFGIIPTVFQNVIEQRQLSIWGNGKTVRDYLHIQDFIDLCEVIIEKQPASADRRRIYNVGSGHGVSLNKLLMMIEDITKTKLRKEYEISRGVDVDKNILDCSRVHQDFGWVSRNSLEDGLLETWHWVKEHYS